MVDGLSLREVNDRKGLLNDGFNIILFEHRII